MTTPATAIAQSIIKSGAGFRIPNGSIGSIGSSTTFTSVDYFLGPTKYSNNSFQGWFVFRPTAASSADYIRRISSLAPATGVVTVDATWADTTLGSEDFYIFPPWLHPQKWIDSINMTLEKIYTENNENASTKPTGTGIADAGFQNTATSAYSTSNASFAKETTANSQFVLQGLGSGKVTLTGASGYVYQDFDATPGEPFRAYAASLATSGDTSVFSVYDQANSAVIDSVSHTYTAFQWASIKGVVPSGNTGLLRVRFGGSANTDIIYYGGQCVLFPSRNRLYLDTKWDSEFKATELVSIQMRGSSPTNRVTPASDVELVTIPRSDYSFSFERGGPNPTTIYWHNQAQAHWYENPLMISGRRQYADFTTALTLASWATDIPGIDKDLFDAYIRAELFSMQDVFKGDPENASRLGRAINDVAAIGSQFKKNNPGVEHVWGRWGGLPN